MNRLLFAIRNFSDKLGKSTRDPRLPLFYLRAYAISLLKHPAPDIYVVSYPKCGRTWVRIALRKYLEFRYGGANITGPVFRLPTGMVLKFDHDLGNWVPAPLRASGLKFRASKYRGKRVCFLVRDPRDVLVSSWHHLRDRENIYRGGLSEFIRDGSLGVEKVVSFMNMWMEHRDVPAAFMLVTYEDMVRKPDETFASIFGFMGLDVDKAALAHVLEETTFEKMRGMELSDGLGEPWMRPGCTGYKESMKIRRGKVGGYREELTPEDIEFLDGLIAEKLSPLLPYTSEVRKP